MSFGIRGILEGFYGPPWPWPARERAVAFLAPSGFNAYVYAPKNDRLHRDRWREPYLPEEQARFASFAARCRARGVDFVFGVSPLAFRYEGDADLERLLAKYEAAAAGGIRSFCLLVDDMPGGLAGEAVSTRFGSVADAHAWLVRAVHERLIAGAADRSLWFVPLRYHGDPRHPYLAVVAAGIPPAVPICWTGPEVCSAELTYEHTRAVADTMRRPVLYWDNHPVNDGGMQHDPHLGALTGRDSRLPEVASGLLANVALQPEASLIALSTVGDYATDPVGYDADRSWQRALLTVAGNDADAAAVAVLARHAHRSPLARGSNERGDAAALLRRLHGSVERSREERRALCAELRGTARAAAAAAERLATMANRRLADDLEPWGEKLARWSAALHPAVDLLDDALANPSLEVGGARTEVLRRLDAARSTLAWVDDDAFDELVRTCLWQVDALRHPAGQSP